MEENEKVFVEDLKRMKLLIKEIFENPSCSGEELYLAFLLGLLQAKGYFFGSKRVNERN